MSETIRFGCPCGAYTQFYQISADKDEARARHDAILRGWFITDSGVRCPKHGPIPTLDDLYPLKANQPAPTPEQLRRMAEDADRRLRDAEAARIKDDKDQRFIGEE